MFGQLGFWELVVILIIALIVFGPGKLPKVGKALGSAIREFKESVSGITKEEIEYKDTQKVESEDKKA